MWYSYRARRFSAMLGMEAGLAVLDMGWQSPGAELHFYNAAIV
jgi:hypothetical protein